MTGKKLITILLILASIMMPTSNIFAQIRLFKQQKFHKQIPPGNYSGIVPLGDDRYAVVSDKSETDGFYIFHITIDTLKAKVTNVVNEGFYSSGLPNRDMEGIAFFPYNNTVFISGEKDNEVYEYDLEGHRTGRRLEMPE